MRDEEHMNKKLPREAWDGQKPRQGSKSKQRIFTYLFMVLYQLELIRYLVS